MTMTTYINNPSVDKNSSSDVKSHTNEDVLRPLKAIRAKCLDCCGYVAKEVRLCTAKDCPLYLYRFGCRIETWRKRLNKSHKDK